MGGTAWVACAWMVVWEDDGDNDEDNVGRPSSEPFGTLLLTVDDGGEWMESREGKGKGEGRRGVVEERRGETTDPQI